jgi:hypothetical protein
MSINEISRNFKGIWIPREIWLRNDLDFLDKLVLAEIDSLDHPEKGCTASNEYFCNFFNVNQRALQRSLSRLKNLNLIIYEDFDGRVRTLRSNLKSVYKLFKSTHDKFDTSHMSDLSPLPKGDTLSIYNKEDNKVPPLTPPDPEPSESKKPSKEEEEEIAKRYKERPKNYPTIKNREAWERSVLQEIRKCVASDKNLDAVARKHKNEATQRDLKKIGEWTVYACDDQVEFTSGSCFKAVKYRIADEEWYDQVFWEK